MSLNEFRWCMMPYTVVTENPGHVLFVNRRYKWLGFGQSGWCDYKDDAYLLPVTEVDLDNLQAILSRASGNEWWLYNDGSTPNVSKEHKLAYIDRVMEIADAIPGFNQYMLPTRIVMMQRGHRPRQLSPVSRHDALWSVRNAAGMPLGMIKRPDSMQHDPLADPRYWVPIERVPPSVRTYCHDINPVAETKEYILRDGTEISHAYMRVLSGLIDTEGLRA